MVIPLHILGKYCPPAKRNQLAREWQAARTRQLETELAVAEAEILLGAFAPLRLGVEKEDLTQRRQDAKEATTPIRQAVLARMNGHPVHVRDLANLTGFNPTYAEAVIRQMCLEGRLERVSRGMYRKFIPQTDQTISNRPARV